MGISRHLTFLWLVDVDRYDCHDGGKDEDQFEAGSESVRLMEWRKFAFA